MKQEYRLLVYLALFMVLTGCLGVPKNVQPVQGFDVDQYVGTWYEIARLDHSFERGLSQVTATYTKRESGGISVVNRGFSEQKGRWKSAEGKAYFVRDEQTAYLKVSFFGPFYGSYVVFELDQEYHYAFVTGPKKSYLWFLSRTPSVSSALKQQFINRIQALGFDSDQIIWVDQDQS